MKFATKTIHAGIEPDPSTGAVMTPIYQTSTYAQAAPGDHQGYEYARTQNPTRHALEANLAALENGADGICFGSGLAAMDAILKLLDAQNIKEADYASNRSYVAARGVLASKHAPEEEGLIKGAVKKAFAIHPLTKLSI